MKISISSVPVADQDDALWFYTEILGFVKKMDLPDEYNMAPISERS